MEMRPGYKKTEVGLIPEDWGVDCVENLADIATGGRNTQDRVDNGQYPFFVRSQVVEYINSYSFDGEAVLTAGDGVGTGKVFHYINGKFDVHQRVYRISGFDESINGYFFYLYFSTHFYNRIMQMTAKSSVDSVRRDMIAKMLIPLPPPAEQEAIAEALSDADALIESLEQLIAKKLQIKQGAMQELLTGKKRLPGFEKKPGYKQTEVGLIPEDWDVFDYVSFGQVIDGDRGFNYPSAKDLRDSGHCLFLNAGNVTRGGFRFTECQFISSEKDKKLNKGKLTRGDVVLTTRGTIGNFAYLTKGVPYEHIRINSGMVILRNTSKSVANWYQYLVLRSRIVESQLERLSFGSAQPQLTVKGISTLKIPLPSTKAEQEAIATILREMDAEIEILEAKLAKACQVKQGMMQALLTGRIRLI